MKKKIEIEIDDKGNVSVLNNSGAQVTIEQNEAGFCIIVPAARKKESASWESINSYEDAFEALQPRWYIGGASDISQCDPNKAPMFDTSNHHTSEASCIDTQKYIKRKLIAQALGARLFLVGEENHRISIRASLADITFSFDTEKQVERFEQICQKEGLL